MCNVKYYNANYQIIQKIENINKHFGVKIESYIQIISISLLVFITSILFLSSVILFFHKPISGLPLIVGTIVSIFFLFYLSKLYFVNYWLYKGVSILFITCMLLIPGMILAGNLFDVSVDGLRYHQEGVIQLVQEEWNPMYDKFLPKDNPVNGIWIKHYPKGPWYCAASLYSLTGRIEYGKFFNYIAVLTAFFYLLQLLIKIFSSNIILAVLITLIATINPICPGQIMTYYVDCQMSSYLSILISVLILYIIQQRILYLVSIILSIIILANIKLTGIIYAGILVFSGFIVLSIRDKLFHYKEAVLFLFAALFATVIIGFNPYITNTRDFGNPFYPAIGANKIDIIDSQWPLQESHQERENRIFQLLKTIYYSPQSKKFELCHISISHSIPYWGVWDARIAGFGPLFNIIFTLALLACIPIGIILYKNQKENFKYLIYFITILFGSIFITPACWWARLAPHLWVFPIAILVISFKIFSGRPFFPLLMLILLFINVGLCITQASQVQISSTKLMRSHLKLLSTVEQPVQIYLGELYFRPLITRLKEYGIEAIEVKSISDLTLPHKMALVRPESDVIVAYRKKIGQ